MVLTEQQRSDLKTAKGLLRSALEEICVLLDKETVTKEMFADALSDTKAARQFMVSVANYRPWPPMTKKERKAYSKVKERGNNTETREATA